MFETTAEMSAKARASGSITCASLHVSNSTNASVQHYRREEQQQSLNARNESLLVSMPDHVQHSPHFQRRSPQYGTMSDQQRVLPQHHGTGDAFVRCWRSVLAMFGSAHVTAHILAQTLITNPRPRHASQMKGSTPSARQVRMHSGTSPQIVAQL